VRAADDGRGARPRGTAFYRWSMSSARVAAAAARRRSGTSPRKRGRARMYEAWRLSSENLYADGGRRGLRRGKKISVMLQSAPT